MARLRARRARGRPIPIPELCDRYGRLYTAAITDVLDHLGLQAYEKFGVF
jgi:hypothetical protein